MGRAALPVGGDPVVTVDGAGRITFINAQAERVFGYGREELLGQQVERLIPERLREVHRRHREEYVAAPNVRKMAQGLALRGLRKDGTELPLDISLSPLLSPEGLSITTIIRDVTEREQYLERLKAARAEAERERALLQTVVDSAPVGILFVEPPTNEVRRQIPVLASAAPVREASGAVRGVVVSVKDISSTWRAYRGRAPPSPSPCHLPPESRRPRRPGRKARARPWSPPETAAPHGPVGATPTHSSCGRTPRTGGTPRRTPSSPRHPPSARSWRRTCRRPRRRPRRCARAAASRAA